MSTLLAVDIKEILGAYEPFLTDAIDHCISMQIPMRDFEIDHICYRCETTNQYRYVCDALISSGLGSLLLEGMIGGRPISTIKLSSPIVFDKWSICCLEVTCPKPGRVHNVGFEHIEVVIDPQNLHGFKNSECLALFAAQYPAVSFDWKAACKDINADICVALPAGGSVKFHARPLHEVCAYEIEHQHYAPVPEDYFAMAEASVAIKEASL